MDDTGNGAKVVEASDNPATAESSQSLNQNGKRRTGKTSVVTPAQAIEILQQSLLEAEKAGVEVSITPMYHHGRRSVIIVLANMEIVENRLVMTDGTQHPAQ